MRLVTIADLKLNDDEKLTLCIQCSVKVLWTLSWPRHSVLLVTQRTMSANPVILRGSFLCPQSSLLDPRVSWDKFGSYLSTYAFLCYLYPKSRYLPWSYPRKPFFRTFRTLYYCYSCGPCLSTDVVLKVGTECPEFCIQWSCNWMDWCIPWKQKQWTH
jgi:hypothetical protein